MEPVRVKVYGLFSVTKEKYILQLVLTVLFAGLLVYIAQSAPRMDQRQAPPEYAALVWYLDRAPYVAAAILGLVTVEAYFVFRAFARKEAEQRAALARKTAAQAASAASPAAKADGPPASASGPEPVDQKAALRG